MEDGTKSTDHQLKVKKPKGKESELDSEEADEESGEELKVMPKRVQSAYNFFMAEHSATLRNKGMTAPEAMKAAATAWGELNDNDKVRFNKLSNLDLMR
jgi:hypothetical protein